MKKIFSYALMLIATTVAFTSCETDNDSNPTLLTPTEFTLNEPAVQGAPIDLATSTSVELTWSQPQFTTMNAPVAAQYEVQVSTTGEFTTKYDESADDNTGADYFAFSETYTDCKVNLTTTLLAKALEQLNEWEEDNVPSDVDVSVRVRAFVRNASMENISEVLSNVVSFKAVPYYVVLKNADPIMWYLVGNMFGGKWGSSIGVDALPMFLVPDCTYDKKTGAGEIEYTNFFTTGDYKDNHECDGSGFKIQNSAFDWNTGMTGNFSKYGEIIQRNGDDGGHIVAPADGYYTIKMNTADNTATMTAYEGDVKDYGVIQLSGSFNDWTDTPMLPYNTEGVENHAWYYVMDVPADGVQFKFKIAGSWDSNWGYGANDGDVNFCGACNAGGKNLGLKEGKYVISFNDITGSFSIVQL